MIVVDASAVLEMLLYTPSGAHVEEVLARGDAAASDLVDAEVFSGLIRARKDGRLAQSELTCRVELLRDADIERYPRGIESTVLRGGAKRLRRTVCRLGHHATVPRTHHG